jgi:hypothetical protein
MPGRDFWFLSTGRWPLGIVTQNRALRGSGGRTRLETTRSTLSADRCALMALRERGRRRWRRGRRRPVESDDDDDSKFDPADPSLWAALQSKARCSAIHWHAEQYERLRRLHSWEELQCSRPIGYRPRAHTAEHVGSPCEAWIHRGVQHVLSRVLEPSMHALEWSTGSSSRYYLHWVGSLHSVEHEKVWAQQVFELWQPAFPRMSSLVGS